MGRGSAAVGDGFGGSRSWCSVPKVTAADGRRDGGRCGVHYVLIKRSSLPSLGVPAPAAAPAAVQRINTSNQRRPRELTAEPKPSEELCWYNWSHCTTEEHLHSAEGSQEGPGSPVAPVLSLIQACHPPDFIPFPAIRASQPTQCCPCSPGRCG